MNGIYKQGGRNTESDLFGENGKYVNSPQSLNKKLNGIN